MGVGMPPTTPRGSTHHLKLPSSVERIEGGSDARDLSGGALSSTRLLLSRTCMCKGLQEIGCLGNCSCSSSHLHPRRVSGSHVRRTSMDTLRTFESSLIGKGEAAQHTACHQAAAHCDGFDTMNSSGMGGESNQQGLPYEDITCSFVRPSPGIASRLRQTSTVSSDNESTYSGNSSTSSGSNQSGSSSHAGSRGQSKGSSCTSPKALPTGGLSRLRLQSNARDQSGSIPIDDSTPIDAAPGIAPLKRKRPPKLTIPVQDVAAGPLTSREVEIDEEPVTEVTMVGSYYGFYCKRGKREVLEDAYQVIPEVDGDPTQAFFGVYDGHGGRKAAEFAATHLAENIIRAMSLAGDHDGAQEAAVREGYLNTDKAFLGQDEDKISGGASCVTSIVKGGNLYVANAGDCRAVLSRLGVAEALTQDHRASREDERQRIEDLGGLVVDCSGVWRVQNTLAVSRGIGDVNLKEYITAEPDVHIVPVTSDCEFLVLASDGLWDVVSNQEAVSTARAFLDLDHSSSSCGGRSGEVTNGPTESGQSRDESGNSPRVQGGSLPGAEAFYAQSPRQAGAKKNGTPKKYSRSQTWSGGRSTPKFSGVGTPRATGSFSPRQSPRGSPKASPRTRVRGSKRTFGQGWDTESRNSTQAQGDDLVPSEESGEEVECRSSRKARGEVGFAAPSVPKSGPVAACQKLGDLAVSRGTPDDVSVLIIWLEKFHQVAGKAAYRGGSSKVRLPAHLARTGSGTVPGPIRVLERSESGSGTHAGRAQDSTDVNTPPRKRQTPSIDFDMDFATTFAPVVDADP